MASRDIKDLTPKMQVLAHAFVRECAANGLDVLIYCTLRTHEEQEELYASGRTKKGKILTNARGGQSKHNFGEAFDAVPIFNGKPQWNNELALLKMGECGERVGLAWAGRWRGKLKESVHFEV